MAARFRTLLSEKQRQTEPQTDAARERAAFDRARAAAELPIKARAAALAWALAALFSGLIAFLTWNDRMGFTNPGFVIGVCFAVGAALTFAVSFSRRSRHEEHEGHEGHEVKKRRLLKADLTTRRPL